MMTTELFVIYLLVFLAVLCVCWSLARLHRRQRSADDGFERELPEFIRCWQGGIFCCTDLFGKIFERLHRGEESKLQQEIHSAGYDIESRLFYGAQLFWGLMGAALSTLLAVGILPDIHHGLRCLLILFCGVLGYSYPRLHLLRQTRLRSAEVLSTLPFALDLIASAMSAGLDFNSAVRYLLEMSADNLLSREFRIYLHETELGKNRTEALRAMEKHIGNPEFSRLVCSIAFGIDSGMAVGEIMKNQSSDMRRMRQMRAEELAQKAPSKMIFPMALFILPAVFLMVAVPIGVRFLHSGAGAFFGAVAK